MRITHFIVFTLLVLAPPVFADDNRSMSSDIGDLSTKILGGIEAKQGDWPWIAALLRSSEANTYQAQYCSGVLIDDTWILTAAHCAEGMTAGDINVAVGVFDLKNFSGSRITVKSIHIHPQYNDDTQNDIALLELNSSSSQPKITLFSGESKENAPPSMVGRMLTAIGWGMADGSSQWYYPSKLRQVNLPAVADSYCNNIYPTPLIASQLCAGYHEGKDVCNGDSGGPVVSQIDGDWAHIGLVSYGYPCADYFGWYGVYTRTSAYVDFIKQYVPRAHFTGKSATATLPWLQLLLL